MIIFTSPGAEGKTHITNARTEEAFFLGTTLKIGNGGKAKLKQTTNWTGKTFRRRSTGWETVMNAPLPKLVKRLSDRGFCSPEGEPIPKAGWAFLDADQIVNLYSNVNRGIQNYYRFTDNWGQLHRVQYILEYSLAKTLAVKFNISVPKVFKRFGKGFPILIEGKKGKADRTVSFYLNRDWAKRREVFHNGTQADIDLVRTVIQMRTRSKLGKPCCICADAGPIVLHHVRHVRKLTNKRVATPRRLTDKPFWQEELRANNQQMAIYATGLLYQAGVPHGETVRDRPVVKVVRYGLTQYCFPDEHTVELCEKQIARYNEYPPEPRRPPRAE